MVRRTDVKRPPAKKKAAQAKPKATPAKKKAARARPKPTSPKTAAADVVKRADRSPAGRIEVRNVNVPGYRSTVDAAKYEAMRSTLLAVLPRGPPGLTQNEMLEAALPKLPQDHFPGGDKAMWWIKTVQLDQEARGAMKRSATKPLRWWRTST